MMVDHLTFETIWIKGKHNVEADALSCFPCSQAMTEDELAVLCFAEANTTLGTQSENPEGQEASLNALCPADRNITDDCLCELQSFTSEDATFKLVVEFTWFTVFQPQSREHSQ
jgi:hypothetical protein